MSNFIFSRRELQRILYRLASHLSPEQVASLVERLNKRGDQRLPAMWEAVMLDALSSVAPLRHEIVLPGGTRPDFELAVADGLPLILGDITTVSDAGLDEQNPVQTLSAELSRLAAKYGLNGNHFGYDVRGDSDGPYANSRMKLFLPDRGPLLTLMKHEVEPWVKGLAATRPVKAAMKYAQDGVAFTLTYDTSQRYATGSYLSYDVAVSRSKNPLFRALKSKVDQLRTSPPESLRMIIACDGDCALLHQTGMSRPPGSFNAREVAEDFLRQNHTIDFVLLVGVTETHQVLATERSYQIMLDLVAAPLRARSSRVSASAIAQIETLIRQAAERLPRPVQTPVNAVRRCQEPGFGPDMIGGFVMSANRIKISARALQRLLAGEVSSDAFLEAHDWQAGSHPNPFRLMAQRGLMITSVVVEAGGEKDDDWLEFSFGLPGPAAGPFRASPPTDDGSDAA